LFQPLFGIYLKANAKACTGGSVVRMSDLQLAVVGSNPGHGTDDYFSEVSLYLWDVTITQVNSALHLFGVAKSSTSFGWGKGGKFASAGWQVTLCDPHMVYDFQ